MERTKNISYEPLTAPIPNAVYVGLKQLSAFIKLSGGRTVSGFNPAQGIAAGRCAPMQKKNMKQIIPIFLILGLFSCSNIRTKENKTEIAAKEKNQKELKNFDLISDFEKNKGTFNSDTFDLMNHSTEGGEIVVFHTSEKEYLVIDIWLYGEMGKQNTKFWTDNDFEFKVVKETNYDYDRPMYEPDFKITETTYFYSYSDSTFKIFDQGKSLIQDSLYLERRKEIEEFFTEMTKEIEIVK